MKAVLWLGIMFLKQISRLRFKQSRISMLIPRIYVLGHFLNFLVIFVYSKLLFTEVEVASGGYLPSGEAAR